MRLSFSNRRSYKEQILIYEGCSDGSESIEAFSFFLFVPIVRSHIKNAIEKLGDYDAIHIRHSDYQTDYKTFFNQINVRADRKIVLCTDSFEVQQYAKSFFGDRAVCVSEIPDTDGKPLHHNSDLDRYQTNLTALTDLFVLACAKKLYITRHKEGRLSGFSALAMKLNRRPKLIKRLLYDERQEA
ncbi:MAG: hypothetical protein LBQ52_00715 [Helicobacteraceae bacterium]|jgi:hypothetical protein|nr:hypothetical protein [Helicobacteraceae bacterium]